MDIKIIPNEEKKPYGYIFFSNILKKIYCYAEIELKTDDAKYVDSTPTMICIKIFEEGDGVVKIHLSLNKIDSKIHKAIKKDVEKKFEKGSVILKTFDSTEKVYKFENIREIKAVDNEDIFKEIEKRYGPPENIETIIDNYGDIDRKNIIHYSFFSKEIS